MRDMFRTLISRQDSNNPPAFANAEPSGEVDLSRRGFLVSTIGTSIICGFTGAEAAIFLGGPPPAAGKAAYEPTIWYAIDAAGIVTVNITKAEMGQHIGTALAMIVAEELEVDWSSVRIVYVDSAAKWGMMMTGGSLSVNKSWPVLSRAGAAGRLALIAAGAAILKVDPAQCVAKAGTVSGGGQSVTYAQIVQSGAVLKSYTQDELAKIPLKAPADRTLYKKKIAALDIPSKTTGEAMYGIDAKVAGMVFARPRLPPTRTGSKVVSVDDSKARNVRGYQSYLVIDDPTDTVPGWVLAIASSYPAAIKAADLLKIVWTPGPAASVSEKDIQAHGAKLISDPNAGAIMATGSDDTTQAFKSAASTLEQTYKTATVLHFQLEPLNALAYEKDGIFEIHTGEQWQSLILPALAKALGRPQDSIVIKTYFLGGGFGRRLIGDYLVPVALASKALKKPVKLILTRADECLFDTARSPSVQTLRMAFDSSGSVTAMDHAAAAGWPSEVAAPPMLAKGVNGKPMDPFAIAGADHWYDVGLHRIRALSNDLANSAMRPGYLRSVGPGWTNWALESFMDEAAIQTKVDPVAFRLKMLNGKSPNAGSAPDAVGGALRQASVLKILADKVGWGKTKPPKDSGLGIATTFGVDRDTPTWCACAAYVRVDRTTGVVTVEKLTLVVDAGMIIDSQGAMAQTRGGALWGLSMALHEGTLFEKGRVIDTNLDTYTPLRIANVPEMDISFVESTQAPVGLGEPAVTVVAPAIGNAIFNAVGVRMRDLPISPDTLRAALNKQ